MKSVKLTASVMLAVFIFSGSVQADDLEYRMDQLEQRLRSSGMISIAEDVSRMQGEVRELRGEVERLQFENDQAKIRQREMYLDLEKRMQELENKLAGGAAVSPSEPLAASGNTTTGPSPTSEGTTESVPAPSAPGPGEEAEYLAAFELLKQGRYSDAIKGFNAFLGKYPKGEYTDNAQYWLAEAYYVSRDYPNSLSEFGKLVSQYPQSAKIPGALLKIGYINYERGEYGPARDALSRVTREYPESSAASLARQRLQRMDTEGR